MKNITTILFLLATSIMAIAQKQPVDTTFYSKGEIKTVKYRIGEDGNSEIRYFKKSLNRLDINKPMRDTLFDNEIANYKDWTYYTGDIRIFLHDKSYVLITKGNDGIGTISNCYFKKFGGFYKFLFRELGDVEVILDCDNDTSIYSFELATADTSEGFLSTIKTFHFDRYKEDTKFAAGTYNHIYQCGELGSVQLNFSKDGLLNSFLFYPKNENDTATKYEFYPDFSCKTYGYSFRGVLPAGKCYEYYKNGNIKSVGVYEIILDNKNKRYKNRKNGLWQYFAEDGKLLKNEMWKNGFVVH